MKSGNHSKHLCDRISQFCLKGLELFLELGIFSKYRNLKMNTLTPESPRIYTNNGV